MTYVELLSKEEWVIKCNEILQRDKFHCRCCGCLGYHNGGNFMKMYNLDEVDQLLKDYIFYKWNFSEYLEILSRDVPSANSWGIRKEINCYEEHIYGNLIMAKFDKAPDRDMTQIGCLPIIYPSVDEPTMFIQRYHGGVIKQKNTNEHLGEIIEFIFPNDYSGIYVSIEADYFSSNVFVQINNRLLALLFLKSQIEFKGLNIHHKYYVWGNNPWNYPNDALITLCEDCHQKAHESLIPVYHQGNLYRYATKCPRCNGSGYLPQYSYYEHGICFKCGGDGVIIDEIAPPTIL